jgi:hypothetical protein
MQDKPFYSLMEQLARRFSWEMSSELGEMVLTITMQKVYVIESYDSQGQLVMRFFSKICPVDKMDPKEALKLNFQLPYGYLAIKDGDIVITATQLFKGANPSEVGTVLSNMAYYAQFYGQHYGG